MLPNAAEYSKARRTYCTLFAIAQKGESETGGGPRCLDSL